MTSSTVAAFAALGRIWRSADFAAPLVITDVASLRRVQNLLEEEAGDLTRLFDVTLDEADTFTGKAEQRLSLARSQIYTFTLSPDRMVYRLIEAGEFGEADEDWAAIVDYAARSGKKLNCKPGNVQCGGRCQPGKLNCFHGMTPAQKKAAQAAAKTARAATGGASAAPAAQPAPAPATPPAQPAAPAANPVKTNQTELDSSRADLVNRFGAKTVEAAEKNVQRILDDSDVFIRVGSSSTLEQILGDRFKTAHELGRTQHQIPYLQDDYLTARARVEAKTLGYDEKNTAPGDRPIYAYLGGKDMSGDSHAQVAAAYGSIAIKLRPEVKDRTTFTGADSFKSGIASEVKNDGTPPPPNAASMIGTTRHGYDRGNLPSSYPSYYKDDAQDGGMLRAAARAKTIDDLVPKLAPTGNAYMEAQVHGQVKPSDIAEIRFTPKGAGDRPTPAIAQFAKDNGVDLFVNDRKLSSDELDAAISPPADRRSQQVRDLADALDKGDIDRVVRLAGDLSDSAAQVDLNPGERDRTLKHLRTEAGYDGLPRVGTAQDVTDTWKSGGVLMVRGDSNSGSVTGRDILNQFQTGSFHTGNGIYGNGTYVGHAGKFVGGRYVGHDSATEAKDAKRAVANVAKHGYIDRSTTNTRMALDNTAVVVKQSDLMSDRARISTQIDSWANGERSRLTGNASVFTRRDVQAYNRRVKDTDSAYANTPVTTTVRTLKLNGGLTTRTEQTWEFPAAKAGDPPLRLNIDIDRSQGGRFFTLNDDNGNTIKTVYQSSGTQPNASTIRDLRLPVIERKALESLGLDAPPVIGQVNDPIANRQLQDFNDRLARARQAIGVDQDDVGGSIERLAILRGVDAIALDQSYQPDTFMNLLNRSKVVVQQNPLSWTQARKTGAL